MRYLVGDRLAIHAPVGCEGRLIIEALVDCQGATVTDCDQSQVGFVWAYGLFQDFHSAAAVLNGEISVDLLK